MNRPEVDSDRVALSRNALLTLLMMALGLATWSALSDRFAVLERWNLYLYLGLVVVYLIGERWAFRGREQTGHTIHGWLRYALTASWWVLLFAAPLEYALSGRANLGVTIIGTLLALLGAGLRAWGMRTLGRYFSGHIESWKDHTLIETGPYRAIRHPAYAGVFLLAIGLPLVVNAYASLLLSAAVIGLFVLRIVWEEAFLSERLPGYAAYMRRTSRIIPGIW